MRSFAFALAVLALLTVASDGAEDPEPTNAVVPYEIEFVSDAPESVRWVTVQTAAVTEEEWRAITDHIRSGMGLEDGRIHVRFRPASAPPFPAGVDVHERDVAVGADDWLIGSCDWTGPGPEGQRLGPGADPGFSVRQNTIELVDVPIEDEGIRMLHHQTIQLGPPDGHPAHRMEQVLVAAPDLTRETLEKIIAHFEEQFDTPRMLTLQIFEGEPEWPAKPFITPAMSQHPHLVYRRASDVEQDGRKLTVLPREPEWLRVENGEYVPAEPPRRIASVPDYDIIFTSGGRGPIFHATISTSAATEADFLAIGRDFCANNQTSRSSLTIKILHANAPLDELRAMSGEARWRAWSEWTIGEYRLERPSVPFRSMDELIEPEEIVLRRIVEPKPLDLGDLPITVLHERSIRLGLPQANGQHRPASRIERIVVSAPALDRQTVDRITRHFERTLELPRRLTITIYHGEVDWPEKPLVTPSMRQHPHLVYYRGGELEKVDGVWTAVRLAPEWLRYEDGGLVLTAPPKPD